MNQLRLPRLTGVVRQLLVVLFGAYVLELVLKWQGVNVAPWLALSPGGFEFWQVATYVFVQGMSQPLWLLLGLLFLWWVLSPFEVAFGGRRTLQLCAACTLGGGIAADLLGFFIRGLPPLAGSHPLWFGAMVATTYLYRDRQMSLFGAISMTGQQLLMLLVGLSALNLLYDGNLTQFVAVLGAMAGGIAFIRYMRRPRPRKRPAKKTKRGSSFRVIKGGLTDDDEPPKWLN